MSDGLVNMTEEIPLLQIPTKNEEGVDSEEKNGELSLVDLFFYYKFYFFVLICAVNIYRIRYFLGVADYTLIYLHDNGTYLQLLGYCFALSVVFAPLVDKILSKLDSVFLSLHIVNALITLFFITWLIPNLPFQTVTFALFILARLFTFTVLTDYCSIEFTKKRFGLVTGAGFVAAAIPGAFTFKIVEVVLARFNGNFWMFHLICICMSIPLALIICDVQRNSVSKTLDLEGLKLRSIRSEGRMSVVLTPR